MRVHTRFGGPELRRHAKLWGKGPWDSEPDAALFWWCGFRCLMQRIPLGTWCGYVLVPGGHPWFGLGYDEIDADAHGGLTYAKGEGDFWRVGFDCAHWLDAMPEMTSRLLPMGLRRRMRRGSFGRLLGVYRTYGYVKAETMRLAEQAREVQAWDPKKTTVI